MKVFGEYTIFGGLSELGVMVGVIVFVGVTDGVTLFVGVIVGVLVVVSVGVDVLVIVGVGVGGGGQLKLKDHPTDCIGEVINTVTDVGLGKVLLKVKLPDPIPETLGYPKRLS